VCAVSCAALAGCLEQPEPEPLASHAPRSSVWIGGQGYQAAAAIATNEDGLVVGGSYVEELVAGGERWVATGALDGYVLGLSPAGDVRFAQTFAGPGEERVLDVAVGPHLSAGAAVGSGGRVIVGAQVGQGSFLGSDATDAPNDWTALVAVLDDGGALEWWQASSGSGNHFVRCVAAGADGTVFAAGGFTGELSFDGSRVLAAEQEDAFIAAWSSSGQSLWVRQLTGPDSQKVEQVVTTEDGGVAVYGSYAQALEMPDGAEQPANPHVDRTPFVASFDANGELRWTQVALLSLDDHHHHDAHEKEAYGWGSISTADGGELISVAASGSAFSLHSAHVELANFSTLEISRLSSDGRVLSHDSVPPGKRAVRFQPGALTHGASGALLSASYDGTVAADGEELTSEQRALLLADVTREGDLQNARRFSLDGLALTHQDAASNDGSLWVAAQTYDAVADDHDVLLLAFDVPSSARPVGR
jgi:hypothetical protein